MNITRWLLAAPLALAAALATAGAGAAEVRDRAGLFSAGAVAEAERALTRFEAESGVPATVATVDSLEGRTIEKALVERAKAEQAQGLYVLLAKREQKIAVEASKRFGALNGSSTAAVRRAFVDGGLKAGDYDAALRAGVTSIGEELARAKVKPTAAAPMRRANPAPGGGFGIGSLLGLGLLIFGALFLFRALGSAFGGGGAPGYGAGRPGFGNPGYGAPGGGGGGFFSGLLGGLGGAIAGNWIYDQFRGHGHGGHYGESASYGGAPESAAGDDWSTGAASTGDWGSTGGGDDWGGSGGGDWGGGGGDWGGGGGDGGGW